MPDSATTPAPLIPDFVNALLYALAGAGVPLAFLVVFATLFALESWYTNGLRIAKSAKAAHGFLIRTAAQAMTVPLARVAVAAVSSSLGVALQVGFVAVSSVGGSYAAALLDADRRDTLLATLDLHPFVLFRADTVTANLKLDWIATAHIALILIGLIASYRTDDLRKPFLLAFPYTVVATVAGGWTLICVVFDLVVNLVRLDLTGPSSWPAMRDGYGGLVASGVFALAYMLAFVSALSSSGRIKRLWTGIRD
ncbi:hypothetical protein ACFQS3_10140 [Glycomyces mayteni]|uniref:Uncharacterized protein n=1 Tax=Glycomyces mayteni TaxID=543887 RepID=A0ABW2D5F4_9ACTN|nr:hypothetical protein GCM10025732_30250 [Glycomyces mayteni]